MSTIDVAPENAHDAHGHDHDHPSFLAHHFDTPEQQFDSGKLGIWLFLVTEVLFFGGMFCAYAIFRMLRPDVFEGSSQFLNTKLGAINTGVLLFSSLTMAWAVRCSQTEEYKKLTAMLASTLSCAMIFLGVKSIEYSHKWGMGLLPAGSFFYDPANPHPTATEMVEKHGFSAGTAFFLENGLYFLCAPFALLMVGVLVWLAVSVLKGDKFQTACAMPLSVVCICFFVGVGLGMILESGSDEGHGAHTVAGEHAGDGHVATGDHDHDHASPAKHAAVQVGTDSDLTIRERLATDVTNSGISSELSARERQTTLAQGSVVTDTSTIEGGISETEQNVLTPRTAGIFFGIYYCMTGVHAIHILCGIGVLTWLLIRSVRHDFNRQYFGPVDYVGLYWHLVDLIWIYLFPLLYLIR
ncbi:cytochrome c oxidase subunit 3 [Rubripirellula reticaptiva]|uniref:Cytochrome c oxidase subunit 3 n=1 Tax=Rubripirellula reticaptiva TaxID=2528013 RepID=A0A5C6EQ94_9BACT|nr:cytochrome c oxidase subunit 3 [Rubripirellula reticaptiva]TWU49559.1 Cytochrome c oxidase subunit 3 [Rubripirellula reticaptiva]